VNIPLDEAGLPNAKVSDNKNLAKNEGKKESYPQKQCVEDFVNL
jgi:hypothetical protein